MDLQIVLRALNHRRPAFRHIMAHTPFSRWSNFSLIGRISDAARSRILGAVPFLSRSAPSRITNGSQEGGQTSCPEIEPDQAARLILEHTDDAAFLMDGHGQIRYANGTAAELMRLSGDTRVNGHPRTTSNGALVGPEDFNRIVEKSRAILESSTESARFQLHLGSEEDQRVLDVRLTGLDGESTPPGVIGIMRDVTRRQEAENAVQESEEKFRALTEEALVGTYIVQDNRFTYVNPRLAEITGYEREELLGEINPVSIAHPDDRDRIRSLIEERLEGRTQTVQYDCRVQRKEGGIRHVKVLGTCIQYRNQPTLIGTIVDISSHVEYEQALVDARDEAEQMSNLKTSFLANMSHEIRTPLSAILGYAEVLEEEASPALQEFVELIQNSGERLLETLNSVLDLAQIEAGSINLRPAEFDLAELASNTAKAFQRQAAEKDLELEITAEPESIPGRMDRGLLTRIVTNLTHNAVKFTDEGTVTVRLHGRSDEVELEVVDTGIGIAEEELPHLFQAFRQESRGTRREFEGSGLGLAITKELVDLVDGKIEVESTKGEGTRFHVRLPRYIPEGDPR